MDDFFFFFFFDEDTNTTEEIPAGKLALDHTMFDQFDSSNMRMVWHKQHEKFYVSIIDMIAALTGSDRPRKYWNDLKSKLTAEGSELSEKIGQFKIRASDGKMRNTDMADMDQALRLIQSIPSPKAEPFKLWLAKVGSERLDEIEDPELAINRGLSLYKRKGYPDEWINERLKSIDTRKNLTDEWNRVGIKAGSQYATLTDTITKGWSGKTTREYKEFKGLKKENLRDNMAPVELVINMLAEVVVTEISVARNPDGFMESMEIAKIGSGIARNTKNEIEDKTGKAVVSPLNSKVIRQLNEDK